MAFEALAAPVVTMSPQLHAYMFGLQETLEVKGESDMAEMLTPDKIMEIGEKIRQRVLETATPEEILAGLTNAERRLLLRLLQEELGTSSGEGSNSNGEAA